MYLYELNRIETLIGNRLWRTKAAEIVENADDVQVYIAKNSTSCYIIIGWTML